MKAAEASSAGQTSRNNAAAICQLCQPIALALAADINKMTAAPNKISPI